MLNPGFVCGFFFRYALISEQFRATQLSCSRCLHRKSAIYCYHTHEHPHTHTHAVGPNSSARTRRRPFSQRTKPGVSRHDRFSHEGRYAMQIRTADRTIAASVFFFYSVLSELRISNDPTKSHWRVSSLTPKLTPFLNGGSTPTPRSLCTYVRSQ